mmetsp:Transcript_113457/g.225842  ORF Transcript_113457/g.225842 Transcript_113457/m.225842 type:complete len:80 (+) Transcript_113457:613-852(+)
MCRRGDPTMMAERTTPKSLSGNASVLGNTTTTVHRLLTLHSSFQTVGKSSTKTVNEVAMDLNTMLQYQTNKLGRLCQPC